MKCSVPECDREAQYKSVCLCQKHYFRKYRYGTTELVRKPSIGRKITPNGYVRVYVGTHILKTYGGYIFEHRKVAFEKYGINLPDCELCGIELNWNVCHIDHIDNDRQNNAPVNLRPLCRGCNTRREYPEAHTMKGNHAIEFMGMTLTANEWSKATNGYLSQGTIVRRIKSGMSPERALMSPKITHIGSNGFGVPYTHEGLIEIAKHYRTEAKKLSRL